MSDQEEVAGTSEAGGGGRFQILQPNRDLQSNWEVDLAKNLEEYLLKICSGEITTDQEHAHHTVNFAEAALLLQGSVQVYSRKVEYLYSLVLHALEFLSQKRQDQQEKASIQQDGSEANAVVDEENEIFLGLDDVPAEAKNCLDDGLSKDDTSNRFLKPPANLLVLEGDCLDNSGDGGELESYLLATCDFFGDFLLLDPCDAGAIYDFLKTTDNAREEAAPHRGSSLKAKSHHSVFLSPTARSGGPAQKSCLGKNQSVNLNQPSDNNCAFNINNDDISSGPPEDHYYPQDDMWHAEEPDVGCSNSRDDSDDDDDDDPWKPLNPHEPGDLKIKPFRKGNFGRQIINRTKRSILACQFPVAKLDNFISQEFAESFEAQIHLQERMPASKSPPPYEKLRRSLAFDVQETFDDLGGVEDGNDANGGENDVPDFDQGDFDLTQNTYNMETDVPLYQGTQNDDANNFDGPEALSQDNLDSNASLEDLCRSHLDALLANIAENEKQTEIAARVSTWKHRIEHTLEEQEAQPPFDIHLYGERILDKLSSEAGCGVSMSFTDVVRGQPKHDVARTFSALLQLVNNGNVELQRPPPATKGELVCYTGTNPFHVKLLRHHKRREETEIQSPPPRKRAKTPLRKARGNPNPNPPPTAEATTKSSSPLMSPRRKGRGNPNPNPNPPTPEAIKSSPLRNGHVPVKIRTGSEGKRRRKSRTDLQSPGST